MSVSYLDEYWTFCSAVYLGYVVYCICHLFDKYTKYFINQLWQLGGRGRVKQADTWC